MGEGKDMYFLLILGVKIDAYTIEVCTVFVYVCYQLNVYGGSVRPRPNGFRDEHKHIRLIYEKLKYSDFYFYLSTAIKTNAGYV